METYDVEIMPQAEEELFEIGYFIALNNPKNSLRFMDELVAAFTGTLSQVGRVSLWSETT